MTHPPVVADFHDCRFLGLENRATCPPWYSGIEPGATKLDDLGGEKPWGWRLKGNGQQTVQVLLQKELMWFSGRIFLLQSTLLVFVWQGGEVSNLYIYIYMYNIYIPWEPTTFIFRGYNTYIGGLKPSFVMVLGSKGLYIYIYFLLPLPGEMIQFDPIVFKWVETTVNLVGSLPGMRKREAFVEKDLLLLEKETSLCWINSICSFNHEDVGAMCDMTNLFMRRISIFLLGCSKHILNITRQLND